MHGTTRLKFTKQYFDVLYVCGRADGILPCRINMCGEQTLNENCEHVLVKFV